MSCRGIGCALTVLVFPVYVREVVCILCVVRQWSRLGVVVKYILSATWLLSLVESSNIRSIFRDIHKKEHHC